MPAKELQKKLSDGVELMFEGVKTVLTENWTNRKRMLRLANYELKSQNNGTVFGFLWNFFNPALQIAVYWFVFAIGLNTQPPQGNYPYIIWMIVGIIPWFFINTAMMSSATSIYSYSAILKRMYLPLSIVPVKTIISAFIGHLWSMLVVFVIIIFSGSPVNSMVYQLPYYMFAIIVFLVGYGLFASAINVVFKDYQKLFSAVVRLLFYLTPVVWVQDRLPENLRFALKLNPLAYIIDGYRNCILYGVSLNVHWRQGLWFWACSLFLFIYGSAVHMKFRKKFMDLL